MEQQSPQAALSTTLVSMSLILLVVFVYLNSIAKVNPQKSKQALSSIQHTFAPQVKISPADELKQAKLKALKSLAAQVSSVLPQIPGSTPPAIVDDAINVTFPSDSMFLSGDSLLNPEGMTVFNQFAEKIKGLNAALEVQVHTGSTAQANQRYASQWQLSIEQAAAIFRLMQAYGIESSRLSAAGFGDSRPLSVGGVLVDDTKNRRVVLLLRPVISTPQPS